MTNASIEVEKAVNEQLHIQQSDSPDDFSLYSNKTKIKLDFANTLKRNSGSIKEFYCLPSIAIFKNPFIDDAWTLCIVFSFLCFQFYITWERVKK